MTMELTDMTVYETTYNVCTDNIDIPAGTLLMFEKGEPSVFPNRFVVFDGPFKGAEFSYVSDILVWAGLVEVIL